MSSKGTYLLRKIVIARGLAELTVLFILALAPLVLLAFGKFFALHIMLRVILCCLSPVAIWLAWGLLQINFMITLSETGLSSRSLSRKQILAWDEMISIKQNTTMGFREYRLTHQGGQLCFPASFEKLPQLIESIRDHLPQRGRATITGAQIFRLSKIVYSFEIVKAVFQFAFAVLVFWFYDSLRHSGHSVQEDLILILGLAIIVAAVVIWRFIQTLLIAQEVRLDKDRLELKSLFGSASLEWGQISRVSNAGLLYPEGLIINAGKKNYLVANTIDCFDEFSEELTERLSKR